MKRTGVAFLLVVALAGTAWAQMDMLPQIFRDLPPELQQGLPEEMSFTEYRRLNRNVDFFTKFMSIFIPGYSRRVHDRRVQVNRFRWIRNLAVDPASTSAGPAATKPPPATGRRRRSGE